MAETQTRAPDGVTLVLHLLVHAFFLRLVGWLPTLG